ncbi:hypothetical protein P3X46_026060 [Hevea brasiliensis]|uniref:Uncharacterized protein n=1 Tax=Hevea brasiliensis TaxID=3981 RepID=A0ABQ9KYT9_HEVBR|nr:hypothetical protein P3X46_026060 [Hevea brasiliensis]
MALDKTLLAINTITIACSLLLAVAVEAQVETPGLKPAPAPAPNASSLSYFPAKLMGLVGFAVSFFVLKLVA